MNKLHKLLGLVMVVPVVLWAATGFVFLAKPGYSSAYGQITPTLYEFDRPVQFSGLGNWSQIKLLRTTLGYHLLTHEANTWTHRDPFTFAVKQTPTPDEVRALIRDVTKHNPQRYGAITSVEGSSVLTDTDVVITLDWNTLTMRQEGSDTRLIDTLYRIHYLQWLGSPLANKILGFFGLLLLLVLSLVGVSAYLRGIGKKGARN